VKDGTEFRKGDLAAKRLARKEAQLAAEKKKVEAARHAGKSKPITTLRRSSWKGKKLKNRARSPASSLTT